MVRSNVLSEHLTGNWYLKKRLFGYKVMVEVEQLTMNNIDFSIDPAVRFYRKVKSKDLEELNIKIKE